MDKQVDLDLKKNEKQFRNQKKELNQYFDKQEQTLSEKHFEELKKLEKSQKTKLIQYEKEAMRKREKDRKALEREIAAETKAFRKQTQRKLQDLTIFTEILNDLDNFVRSDTTVLDRIRIFSSQHNLGQVDSRTRQEIKAERQRVEEIIMQRRHEMDAQQIEQELDMITSGLNMVLEQMREKQADECKSLQKKYLADLWHLKKDRLMMQENLDMDEVRNYFTIKKNYQVLKINTEAKELQSNALRSLERLAKTHQLELKTLHKLTKSANASNKKLNKAITKNYQKTPASPTALVSPSMQSEINSLFASKSLLDLLNEQEPNRIQTPNNRYTNNRAESKVSLFQNTNNNNVSNNILDGDHHKQSNSLEKALNDFDNIFEENLNHINNSDNRINSSSVCLKLERNLEDEIGPPNPLGEVRNFQSRQWASELQGQYELADKMRQMHLEMAKVLIEEEKKALQHFRDFYMARMRELYDNIETASLPDYRKSRLRLNELPRAEIKSEEEVTDDKDSCAYPPHEDDGRRDETHSCNEDDINDINQNFTATKSPIINNNNDVSNVNNNLISCISPSRYHRPTSDFSSILSLDHSPEEITKARQMYSTKISSNMHITPLLTDLSRL